MKKTLLVTLLTLMLICCFSAAALADANFTFSDTSVSVFENESVQLQILAQGECKDAVVTYTSGQQRTATVDVYGVVTGLKKGSTNVTASCTVGNKKYRAQVKINVLRAVTDIVVNENNWNVYPAGTEALSELVAADDELPVLVMNPNRRLTVSATLYPTDASNRKVTITSSDLAVLKVNGSAIQSVNAGQCVLTVASAQNPEVYKEYLVIVTTPVKSISVVADQSTLYLGESCAVNAMVSPSSATFQSVTWKSSNTRIAVVDEYGIVTAVGKGTASIIATAMDGSNVSGNCRITVDVAPTDITLNTNDFILNVGASKGLRATVLPNTANDRSVNWYSDDVSVATVTAGGQVKGVSVGSCTITAASKSMPDVSASVTVTVVQPVTKVSFINSSATVNVGETVTLYTSVQPSNATIPDVSFTSSNTKIATVDNDGVVYGVKAGTCRITAKSTDGSNRSASINVKVLQPVEGVHMKSDSYNVGVNESATLTAVLEPTDASNKNMTWYVEDTRLAKIRGTNNQPKVTGLAWGNTTVYGVTEDGNYTTSANLHVGNYDKALSITDLYLQNNAVKIAVRNESNMNITRFDFMVELFDIYDQPIMCNYSGIEYFNGYYAYTLTEGNSTVHGRFTFRDYVQPSVEIGRVVMSITSYRTDTGYVREIKRSARPKHEYKSPSYVGPLEPDTSEITGNE